ncbi:MAG: AraC family transcriptional regulator ligand-binding domain-containing protein [Polyangiales bacterium]
MHERDESEAGEHVVISLVFVRAVLDLIRERAPQLSFPELSQVDLSTLSDPSLGIARHDFSAMLMRVADELNDPHFAISVGAQLQPSHLHIVGPLVMNSTTSRRALETSAELQRSVIGGASWKLTNQDGEARIEHPMSTLPSARIDADLYVASTYRGCLLYWGESVRPYLRAQFAYPTPADLTHYHALFGANVSFDAPVSGVAFPEHMLDVVRSSVDPRFAENLAEFARANYLREVPSQAASTVVRMALVSANSLRGIELAQIASEFGMSERTLRRRLEREHTTFRRIREQVRLERALQLLQTTTQTIKEIANDVGYSEVNAFRRAFKSWCGESPSAFRDGKG